VAYFGLGLGVSRVAACLTSRSRGLRFATPLNSVVRRDISFWGTVILREKVDIQGIEPLFFEYMHPNHRKLSKPDSTYFRKKSEIRVGGLRSWHFSGVVVLLTRGSTFYRGIGFFRVQLS